MIKFRTFLFLISVICRSISGFGQLEINLEGDLKYDTILNNTLNVNGTKNDYLSFFGKNIFSEDFNYWPENCATPFNIGVSKKEYILLSQTNGDGCCSYIEIGEFNPKMFINTIVKDFANLNLPTLKTKLGIHIGLEINDLISIYNVPYKSYDTLNYRILYYKWGKNDYPPGSPAYVARFVFRNDKLIKYSFGFMPFHAVPALNFICENHMIVESIRETERISGMSENHEQLLKMIKKE